ncbi:MAG TPA: hypothetical protein PLU36_00905 [Chitinophagaceae bacterium]|nr:hypothetical protein [Chitinophagaceae bacterium]MCC6634087.1 hypothetical protein [Chitinophagaceae bacterium]HMZ45338.1 hypothetical protein [Chitinophagaceae bacterium]HNF30122.1 hypothetical protein [Chitinophagaceae bacterium]HNJ58773.1 hypothetical protein [Chitinophagaceae bacterium]
MNTPNVQIPPSTKFSNVQLELLNLFAHNVSDEELIELKDVLGKRFLSKLSNDVNKAIEEKNITNNDLEKWLNEKS